MPHDEPPLNFNVVNKFMVVADPEPDPVTVAEYAKQRGLDFHAAYDVVLQENRRNAIAKLRECLAQGYDLRLITYDLLALL